MLRFLTAGESHGRELLGIIEGIPAGVRIRKEYIDTQLARRQKGYGRGTRMDIEKDTVQITGGVRNGISTGGPVSVIIRNRDATLDEKPPVYCPRPGHADLAGCLKYGFSDARNVLERASARETAMRVALGSVAREFLKEFGVEIISYVTEIGGIRARKMDDYLQAFQKAESSPLRCPDGNAEKKMMAVIERAKRRGDTVGGIFEVVCLGVVPGLGSYIQWDRRLDAKIAMAIMSIQGIKGVEFGLGFEMARRMGRGVHDAIFYDKKKGWYRKSNNCGGIEGGMSTGSPVVVRGVMKPIATLMNPLESVDIRNRKKTVAAQERSDVCVVPSAGVVGEAMVALVLANMYIEKFGGDCMKDIKRAFKDYIKRIR